MRILLIHPEDDSADYVQAPGAWDAVFDLASSTQTRTKRSGGPHAPVPLLTPPSLQELRPLKSVIALGCNHLIDKHGFDCWDLVTIEFYSQMVELARMQQLVASNPDGSHFFLTRGGIQAQILKALCPGRAHVLRALQRPMRRVRDKVRRVTRLSATGMLQVLGDKHDSGYRLRRFLPRRHAHHATPVVLLPSAYENASRTMIAYAEAIPDQEFLLVATRQSGKLNVLPRNVRFAPLSLYSRGDVPHSELEDLLKRWRDLKAQFRADHYLSALLSSGCFDSVPEILRRTLAIRDVWLNVFARESVSAVLCADEMNWHTRLPLLIARSRQMPTLACHHGALDWRYSLRETSADVFLAKGRMEWEYLVESCGVAEEKIGIGAPPRAQTESDESVKDSIIFFSEPYEASGGRCETYYQEILPPLANLAMQNGRKLVIKLHPFESRRERTRLAENFLSASQRRILTITEGPLNQDLLQRAWFGVAVTSTTAVDCALNSVPVFLCRWLDFSGTGYAEQFIKFGAAMGLASQREIVDIPLRIPTYKYAQPEEFWDTISREHLQHLFSGNFWPETRFQITAAERVWA